MVEDDGTARAGHYCKLHLKVVAHTKHGESIRVSGSSFVMGKNSPDEALPLVTTPEDYPVWSTPKPIIIPRGVSHSYNYALFSGGEIECWESIPPRAIAPESLELHMTEEFGTSPSGTDAPKPPLLDKVANDASANSLEEFSAAAAAAKGGSLAKLMEERFLVLVCFHLPIVLSKDSQGEWEASWNDSLIAKSENSVSDDIQTMWIGSVHASIPIDDLSSEEKEKIRTVLSKMNCIPVFASSDIVNRAYLGYCKQILWPSFHNVDILDLSHSTWNASGTGPKTRPEATWDQASTMNYWQAYVELNELFAAEVNALTTSREQQAVIWVHDYHLMRLPEELRSREPNCKIAWFLHTPFPSSEIYRILPVRKQLLGGLLKADLVGFQTYDYARHFLSASSRVLEVNTSPKGVEYENHYCSIGVYPIGVDPDFIRKVCTMPAVQRRMQELKETFAGRKILLGVDRLDYIKGMPHKLLGLELFLARRPEWRGKVTLIQVGVPSRQDVDEYQKLSEQVNELVGRINGTHGTLEYSPIHYINQSVPQEELFAIYQMADVCLVTSVRDGMNLVSHEYVVAQDTSTSSTDGPGVLLLSEFAGSAQSLSGAIRVNPWNTEELATAIHTALTLTPVERELRHTKLSRYVSSHTSAYWARTFMSEFRAIIRSKPQNIVKMQRLRVGHVVKAYECARRRLIISDYDGTLTRIQPVPELAQPNTGLMETLTVLSNDPRNTVIVMSGRERRFLESWLGHLPIGLAAENGFYHRMPGETEWQSMSESIDLSWKDLVHPIMTYFTERTPGSYIETKENSLAWHYKDADPHFGAWQAKDMQISMEDVLSNLPLAIIQGNHMVEVRHRAVSKSRVLEKVLEFMQNPDFPGVLDVDFIFCVGDDRSDEDMFEHLKELKGSLDAELLHGGEKGKLEAGASRTTLSPPTVASLAAEGDEPTTPSAGDVVARRRRRRPAIFTVHIGNQPSQARSFVENTQELRRVLRAFASISKKDNDLRDLEREESRGGHNTGHHGVGRHREAGSTAGWPFGGKGMRGSDADAGRGSTGMGGEMRRADNVATASAGPSATDGGKSSSLRPR
mmetsp:Transcript_11551/g.33364  ORF Transcript_11551/g.33364 Transcript_11551/m.33364 type:complete len:1079 (-) Transcript_11551:351-3587(-)